MPKRKEKHEEHADETWLLPYSDLLTLLLALFIVMFAMGQIDKQKFESISQQFNIIFSGGGQMTNNNESMVVPMPESVMSVSTGNNTISENNKMMGIKQKLEKEIVANGYSDKVKVGLNGEGLEISIQEVVLFHSGDAEIIPDVYPLLYEVSKMLSDVDNKIKIVGHTDNVPIHTDKFKSNWDLSATRAINVMSYMVDQGGLRPDRFSIQGYGEYAPIYDNSTEEGRAKNRRVEIYLDRKYPANADNTDSAKKNK